MRIYGYHSSRGVDHENDEIIFLVKVRNRVRTGTNTKNGCRLASAVLFRANRAFALCTPYFFVKIFSWTKKLHSFDIEIQTAIVTRAKLETGWSRGHDPNDSHEMAAKQYDTQKRLLINYEQFTLGKQLLQHTAVKIIRRQIVTLLNMPLSVYDFNTGTTDGTRLRVKFKTQILRLSNRTLNYFAYTYNQ